jgi:hypothetical protein
MKTLKKVKVIKEKTCISIDPYLKRKAIDKHGNLSKAVGIALELLLSEPSQNKKVS